MTDRFSYRLVQTEVCNISGTSYHKAKRSTRMFPHPLRKATRSLALACGLFIYNAHTLIRSARRHIRIMHSRLYGFLHVRLYGKMHTHIYRFARLYIRKCTSAYTVFRFLAVWSSDFLPGRRHGLHLYRNLNKIFIKCNKTCIKAYS